MGARLPPNDAGAQLELTSAGDVEQLVRADGTLFLVTTRLGDIRPAGARELGLYFADTRYLSLYALGIARYGVVHLSSESGEGEANRIDLMVSGLGSVDVLDDPQNFMHVERRQSLADGLCETLRLTNFLQRRIAVELTLSFGADYADVFEVRGAKRRARGTSLAPAVGKDVVELGYLGRDGATYTTSVSFRPAPTTLADDCARFELTLDAGETTAIEIRVTPSRNGPLPRVFLPALDRRARARREALDRYVTECATFSCDDAVLQAVLDRSASDLGALRLDLAEGPVLAAGIPWFCAPFGRDTLIAAYEALLLDPELARSSLRVLAAHQGTSSNDRTEEEPGKIFHELRFGEMAAAGEIPHTPYFGSVDATPLFVVLADAYHRATGDRGLLVELRQAIGAALAWIDTASERGRSPVTYAKRSPEGLDNQGWKDSRAGVSYPDGTRATPPIALVEVQGYCVDAYRRGARILRTLGEHALASTYDDRGAVLTSLIEERFWIPEADRYAFALDGNGERLPTVVSNAGHLLWSRLPSPERAKKTAALLLSPSSLADFGVRTLASGQRVYNPLSYHNGTIWPHDNALIAKGMANYGFSAGALAIFEALAAAMPRFPDHRLPELFCGMNGALVRYPVACSPQAWAAAAPFLLLQSLLGLHLSGAESRLSIKNPLLPRSIRRLEVDRLRVGASRVSIRVRRVGKRCHVDRLDVTGSPLRTEIEID